MKASESHLKHGLTEVVSSMPKLTLLAQLQTLLACPYSDLYLGWITNTLL
jgi:hypothetical protein